MKSHSERSSRRLIVASLPSTPVVCALLCAILLATGCAKRYVNEPLDDLDTQAGYRAENYFNKGNSEKLLVFMSFSGGGTRAASLSYGVLEELARTEIAIDGRRVRLLDEIDIISSVSGGSFTSAYFGLVGDRIFDDFEEKFLKRNVQGKLTGKMFSPWVWPKLWSPNYNRDDMAADLYDKLLFEGKTFADLPAGHPPFIIIIASDVTLGTRWQFTQSQFDLICSELDEFPIARAVTASSAVPGAFGTIALRNHAEKCGNTTPDWVDRVLANPDATSRMVNDASEIKLYAEPKRKYVHLVDGGITDNIGVRSVLDLMLKQRVLGLPAVHETISKVEHVLLIVVDAHVEKDPGFSLKDHIGFFKLLGSAVNIPMSRYSFESVELFQETMARRAQEITAARAVLARQTGTEPAPFSVYPVYLQFNHLPDQEDSDFFKTMPTSFRLKPEWVDRLRGMAAENLARDKDYGRMLQGLDAVVKPRPEPPAEARED